MCADNRSGLKVVLRKIGNVLKIHAGIFNFII